MSGLFDDEPPPPMAERPAPDDIKALAYVAQIPDQKTLWETVDAWRHARRRLSPDDNRAIRMALQVAWERITGHQWPRPPPTPKR
jgi:hypothetical protein